MRLNCIEDFGKEIKHNFDLVAIIPNAFILMPGNTKPVFFRFQLLWQGRMGPLMVESFIKI